MVRDLS
jgi:hypothetical protein